MVTGVEVTSPQVNPNTVAVKYWTKMKERALHGSIE